MGVKPQIPEIDQIGGARGIEAGLRLRKLATDAGLQCLSLRRIVWCLLSRRETVASASFNTPLPVSSLESISAAITAARGTSSSSNPICFSASVETKNVTPVTLLPGREILDKLAQIGKPAGLAPFAPPSQHVGRSCEGSRRR